MDHDHKKDHAVWRRLLGMLAEAAVYLAAVLAMMLARTAIGP